MNTAAREGAVRHLYVHLPFCASRCGYCAFVVEVGGRDRRDAYLGALLAESGTQSAVLGSLDTVYFGGGTPTLMRPHRIAALLDAVRPSLAAGAEVSIEANPETVDREHLEALVAAGVTRVSIGAQTFQPELLATLDRAATPDQVRAAVSCAREAGFASVSIDLLFGVPGQTTEGLADDIAQAIALRVDHISWYELELKPGAALTRRGAVLPDDDWAADAYETIVASLEGAGYRWYETANFARPGHECRHSLAYWGAADYLGIGVGAVSTIDGERRRNAPGVDRYIAAEGTPERALEHLDTDTQRRERWMLALRLDEPLDLAWSGPPDHPDALERLVDLGLIERVGAQISLSRHGRFVQNAVLSQLMEYA